MCWLCTDGWHAKMGNFTNVGQSSSVKELVAFYNATQRGVATPAIPTQLDYQGWL